MTEQAKKAYNKEHYEKNKSLIQERVKANYLARKQAGQNVFPIHSEFKDESKNTSGNGESELKKAGKKLSLTTLFLTLLAMAYTAFLVHEMASFYQSVDGSFPYVKAILLESVVISFVLVLKGKTAFGRFLQMGLALIVYAYSIWVISTLSVQSAFESKAKADVFRRTVQEMEREIAEKSELRRVYYKLNRITLAGKVDAQLENLKGDLSRYRIDLARSPKSEVLLSSLLAVVLFRILIMLSNVICLKELGKRYRMKSRFV